MDEALAEYLRHLSLEKNASAHTVKSYREDLTQAIGYFRERAGGKEPELRQLTTRMLRAYLAWLHEQGYAKTTVARRVAAVRSWCRFLCRQGTLTANPADGLRGPRQDKKLPHFLSVAEMNRLLTAPPGDTPAGLRDRAILETLYSAGLRVSELTGLNLDDLDLTACMVTVRGKGKRERLAMIGSKALKALTTWLVGRDAMLAEAGKTATAVFLNQRGTRLSSRSVGRLTSNCASSSASVPKLLPGAGRASMMRSSSCWATCSALLRCPVTPVAPATPGPTPGPTLGRTLGRATLRRP